MAGPAPKTKNWAARENAHKPKGLHVIVCGHVEVSATNKRPVLTEARSAGDLLALDLTVEDAGGVGNQVVVWMQADFHKEVRADQYNRVEVRWGGKAIATFPVINDREHAAAMDKQCKAQNAVAAGGKAASTAKKVVKKAVRAVKKVVGKVAKAVTGGRKTAKKTKAAKKAPKAVGGWAKKRAKRPARKAAAPKRKTAKRAKARRR
jgi:hypothetical protein